MFFYKLLMFKINLIMYWLDVSCNGGLLCTLWYALATKPIAYNPYMVLRFSHGVWKASNTVKKSVFEREEQMPSCYSLEKGVKAVMKCVVDDDAPLFFFTGIWLKKLGAASGIEEALFASSWFASLLEFLPPSTLSNTVFNCHKHILHALSQHFTCGHM